LSGFDLIDDNPTRADSGPLATRWEGRDGKMREVWAFMIEDLMVVR
jgi:hypothetical protein